MNDSAPGWRPDPHDPAVLRYWDGQQWTSNTRIRTEPVPEPESPTLQNPTSSWGRGRSLLLGAVLATILVIMIGGIFVEGSDDTEAAVRAEDTSSEPAAPPETTAPVVPPETVDTPTLAPPPETTVAEPATDLGVPLRDGSFEIVVHSWNNSTAAITVTNIGTGPRVFRFGDLDAFDSQERRFSPTVNTLSPLAYPTLNPGEAASGELYYEMSGAEPDYLLFEDSLTLFSEGVRIRLR